MGAQVVAAIIAVSGVLIQVLVTYLISRQGANDLRVGIDRELSILTRLDPKTVEAEKLNAHVRANINALVSRDIRREVLVEGLVIFGLFYVF
jgi:hypothetical protein